jgi:2-desacetyl-2-hydroxyethyl bacteriochlorophyllide A dehydrogenase
MKMKEQFMKAGVLTGPKQIRVMNVPVPEIGPGLIEIQVKACGVCGSDIHMWKAGKGWGSGDMSNFIMGHEYCGVVTNPGDSDFKVGDRVTFWANLYCGECDMCQAGKEQLCRDVNGTNYIGFVCNGAYAEKFVGKAMNAYKLPDTVSDVAAGLIDPLMVAYHAIKQSNLKLHDKVLVVGSGIIGQLIGGLAKKAGASYVAMSKVNDRKIAKAKEIGDFDEYFDGNDPDRAQKMQEASNGGFDVVFEVVGAEDTINTCLDGVKPGGEIMLVGCPTELIPIDITRVVLREVRLIGCVSCTRTEFTETIDLIASGMIDVEKYVTDIMSLDQLQHAFERLTSKTDPVLKMVIKP